MLVKPKTQLSWPSFFLHLVHGSQQSIIALLLVLFDVNITLRLTTRRKNAKELMLSNVKTRNKQDKGKLPLIKARNKSSSEPGFPFP